MKRITLIGVLLLILHFAYKSETVNAQSNYVVETMRLSHWALDPMTGAMLYRNGRPYRDTGTGVYNFQRTLNPQKTAIICMDCWRDMADPLLEAHFHNVSENIIYPLMLDAKNNGFTLVFLTNNPATTAYNYGVDLALAPLGGNVLYHETYDNPNNPLAFYYWLSARGINTLVYVGFASNACLASRMTSLFYMKRYFPSTYFVPDASAATENIDNWDGHIHENMTEIISKQFEIIDADDLIGALP